MRSSLKSLKINLHTYTGVNHLCMNSLEFLRDLEFIYKYFIIYVKYRIVRDKIEALVLLKKCM